MRVFDMQDSFLISPPFPFVAELHATSRFSYSYSSSPPFAGTATTLIEEMSPDHNFSFIITNQHQQQQQQQLLKAVTQRVERDSSSSSSSSSSRQSVVGLARRANHHHH